MTSLASGQGKDKHNNNRKDNNNNSNNTIFQAWAKLKQCNFVTNDKAKQRI